MSLKESLTGVDIYRITKLPQITQEGFFSSPNFHPKRVRLSGWGETWMKQGMHFSFSPKNKAACNMKIASRLNNAQKIIFPNRKLCQR
jgi:hypothetical protein